MEKSKLRAAVRERISETFGRPVVADAGKLTISVAASTRTELLLLNYALSTLSGDTDPDLVVNLALDYDRFEQLWQGETNASVTLTLRDPLDVSAHVRIPDEPGELLQFEPEESRFSVSCEGWPRNLVLSPLQPSTNFWLQIRGLSHPSSIELQGVGGHVKTRIALELGAMARPTQVIEVFLKAKRLLTNRPGSTRR